MRPELISQDVQKGNTPELNLVVNNTLPEISSRDSLTSGIPLLYPIALMNHDTALQKTFFDPAKGIAIAGFRRQVANFGVCLVCAQFGSDKEVMIKKNDYVTYNGTYNYISREYVETNEGLLGSEIKEGFRERVNVDVAMEKIDAVRDVVEARYEVQLSPNTICKFIESRKKRELGDTFRDRKFNIQFTAGLPAGTAKATAEVTTNGIMMVTPVPVPGGGVKFINSFVDKASVVSEKKIQPGRVYLIKPASYDKKTGTRTANVLRMYVEGIRVGMQAFKMGLIKPGDKGYDVNPDPSNGLTTKTVMDMPFMKAQDKRKIMGAPMLTIDLDMMFSLMQTLSGYHSVTMKFKDSSSGIYFKAEGNSVLPTIEAIVGPTIQYVRGRVWLP